MAIGLSRKFINRIYRYWSANISLPSGSQPFILVPIQDYELHVPGKGLEPLRITPANLKSAVATIFTTRARDSVPCVYLSQILVVSCRSHPAPMTGKVPSLKPRCIAWGPIPRTLPCYQRTKKAQMAGFEPVFREGIPRDILFDVSLSLTVKRHPHFRGRTPRIPCL